MPTLSALCDRWLRETRPLIRHGTWLNYERSMRLHVGPALGDKPVAELERTAIRALGLDLVGRGLAPGSVRVILAALRACLSFAVDDGIITVNPAGGIGRTLRRQLKHVQTKPKAMTPEQGALFLEVAATYRPRQFPVFLCLARTGMRLGEVLGLEWKNVELTARWIYVDQSWAPDGIGPIKNDRPFFADVSQQLVEVLRKAQETRDPMVQWVFPSPRQTPWDRSYIAEVMRALCVRAGLPPGFTPHSLRHGFAATLLRRHAPLGYITRALNHADPKLTLQYARHFPNGDPAIVDGLDTPTRKGG